MKNYLLPLLDKVLLRKRFIIETLFAKLKSSMGLEHTRHRSPINALVHSLPCLAATTRAQPKGNIGNFLQLPHTYPQARHPVPLLTLSKTEVW
ncbi:MAG: transposase [Synechococcus sp. SB0665_bin_28]|nr:transposase [Synechococcus sp. SB0665_bin_28]